MPWVKAFYYGDAQVIPIPDEYRFLDEEIFVNRIGNTITLTPKSQLAAGLEHGLQSFTDDYMAEGRHEQTHNLPEVDF